MKPLIVYQSRTGNTRIIADTIATILNADILSVENVVQDTFNDRTLVGLGSGIYWTRIDSIIYKSASLLPPECNVFVFFTSGMGSSFMLRLFWYFIKKKFNHLGLKLVGNWDCRGYDKLLILKWMGISKGRPNGADIESAKQFALEMKSYLI